MKWLDDDEGLPQQAIRYVKTRPYWAAVVVAIIVVGVLWYLP